RLPLSSAAHKLPPRPSPLLHRPAPSSALLWPPPRPLTAARGLPLPQPDAELRRPPDVWPLLPLQTLWLPPEPSRWPPMPRVLPRYAPLPAAAWPVTAHLRR